MLWVGDMGTGQSICVIMLGSEDERDTEEGSDKAWHNSDDA